MRLAAIYGQRPAYTRQIKELVGTIGAALGWRTVARELVGFVPAGVGVALKGSIAFSGTMAAGRAALFYYQTGRKPTKEAIQAAYKESEAEAKQAAQEVRDSLIASANAAAATTEQAVDTEDIMAPAVVPAATPSAGAADKPEPPVNDPA